MAKATQKIARGKPASSVAASEFDFTRSPIHLLRRAQQRALEIFNHEVGASGLTPRQFVVLLAVQENEGLTQTDLVNRTRIDRSTLADMISRLIKRGLLSRRRTERDQRANAVTITADGRKSLKAALGRIARAEERLLEMVPETRRSAFLDNLGVLARVPEQDAPKDTAKMPAKAPRAAATAKAGGAKSTARSNAATSRKAKAPSLKAATSATASRPAIKPKPKAAAKPRAKAAATSSAQGANVVAAKVEKAAKPAKPKVVKAKAAKPAKKGKK